MAMQIENILSILENYLNIDLHYVYNVPRWVWIVFPLSYSYYKYMTWHYGIFKQMGIPGPRPWPPLGTSFKMFKDGLLAYEDNVKKYGQLVGTFNGRMPMLYVYDVDMLKQWCSILRLPRKHLLTI